MTRPALGPRAPSRRPIGCRVARSCLGRPGCTTPAGQQHKSDFEHQSMWIIVMSPGGSPPQSADQAWKGAPPSNNSGAAVGSRGGSRPERPGATSKFKILKQARQWGGSSARPPFPSRSRSVSREGGGPRALATAPPHLRGRVGCSIAPTRPPPPPPVPLPPTPPFLLSSTPAHASLSPTPTGTPPLLSARPPLAVCDRGSNRGSAPRPPTSPAPLTRARATRAAQSWPTRPSDAPVAAATLPPPPTPPSSPFLFSPHSHPPPPPPSPVITVPLAQ